MIVEQLIFTVISFMIFIYLFFKMMRSNDTSYIIILILEAIGIAINFIEVFMTAKINIIFFIIKYVFAILIPIGILILERRNIIFSEVFNITIARLSLAFGNTKRAKQALLTLLDKNQDSYNAHRMLAEIYEREGGMRKAIDEYVQAVDLNKKDYNSYYKVAELLTQLDKKDEASQMLFSLLNKKPEMYEATTLLGEILIEKERYKEAANIYQEALRFNPASFDLNYNLGIAYTMLNDFQNAKICYEKAAELNSLAYNAKYTLAEIALIYKDLEQAEKRFLEAVEEEELSADGYFELSKIYLMKGDKDTAIKYINLAIDIDSKKIVEKVKKDSIFIPIIARVSIPFNLDSPNFEGKENRLKEKEIKAKEHLEDTFEITRHLSYHDIMQLNRKPKENEHDIEEREI